MIPTVEAMSDDDVYYNIVVSEIKPPSVVPVRLAFTGTLNLSTHLYHYRYTVLISFIHSFIFVYWITDRPQLYIDNNNDIIYIG